MLFREAECVCNYAGIGRLYEPRNHTRHRIVLELALKLDFYNFWVGINDVEEEGRYGNCDIKHPITHFLFLDMFIILMDR